MITVADVTTTPINENKVIEVGNPIACPVICACWLLAYRVKSGIFRDSVANFDGCFRIGPKPCPAEIAQKRRANAASGRKKALNTSNRFILSTPRYTTYIFSNQNKKKVIAGPVCNPNECGNTWGNVSNDGIHNLNIW